MPARRQVLRVDSGSPLRLERIDSAPVAAQPTASDESLSTQSELARDKAVGLAQFNTIANPVTPVSPAHDSANSSAAAATSPGSAQTYHVPSAVLIVENDLSIRKLFRRLLERRGYFVLEIAQADDLARELNDRHIDLLIVDVSPAEPTGAGTLLTLASANPSVKILALSAESLVFDRQEDETSGRVLALRKPFSLEIFVDCVDRLLDRTKPPRSVV